MKRPPLRRVSKHRAAVNRERRRRQEAAWGPHETWRCWFRDRPAALAIAGRCFGEVWGHEILSRERAGRTDENLLNVAGQEKLCNHHNEWVAQHDPEARELGLSKHAWDE